MNQLQYFFRILPSKRICGLNGFHRRLHSKDNYFDDPGVPRVALCKDNQTIAMYHPKKTIDYEKTIPIPRDDPRYAVESVEAIVSNRLHEMDIAHRPVENPNLFHKLPMHDRDVIPTVVELATLFHTSKHRWFRKARKTKYFHSRFKIPE